VGSTVVVVVLARKLEKSVAGRALRDEIEATVGPIM